MRLFGAPPAGYSHPDRMPDAVRIRSGSIDRMPSPQVTRGSAADRSFGDAGAGTLTVTWRAASMARIGMARSRTQRDQSERSTGSPGSELGILQALFRGVLAGRRSAPDRRHMGDLACHLDRPLGDP